MALHGTAWTVEACEPLCKSLGLTVCVPEKQAEKQFHCSTAQSVQDSMSLCLQDVDHLIDTG